MMDSNNVREVRKTAATADPPTMGTVARLKVIVREGRKRWRELGMVPSTTSATPIALRPLTPSYEPELHEPYVDALLAALEMDDVHNIALTGRYGAGKSSIVDGLLSRLDADQRAKHTVVLSLSTLDPDAPDGVERAVQDRDDRGGPDLSLAMTKTNRVQKELVKQLLYREPPRRLPHSRFQRLRNRTWRSSAAVGATLMTLLTVVSALFSVTPELAGTERGFRSLGWWASYGLLFLIGATSLGALHWLVWERFIVRRVSAAGADIELAPRSTSYFDQYLDEITYFFEVTKTSLVIFEDLDRFEDHHIFQSLHDLNTLLNRAAQRERRKTRSGKLPPVRFIYATRDSIFEIEKIGPDQRTDVGRAPRPSEPIGATRTKFFDLVVPIVPFITPVSSRGLLVKELRRIGYVDLSRDLLALVAEQLTDMRLLLNITNEYQVFRHRLFAQEKRAPGLTEDGLFALVVFKNLHPGEFEAVTLGASRLHDLYSYAQVCVENDLRVLRRERDSLRDRETFVAATRVRARRAGDALVLHLSGRIPQVLSEADVRWSVSTAGKTFDDPDSVRDPNVWRGIAQAQSDVEFSAFNGKGINVGAVPLTLKELRTVTGLPLGKTSWNSPDAQELQEELYRLDRLIEEAPTLDFAKLASQGNRHDSTRPDDGQVPSLTEWMDEHLADLSLVAALVRRGYIGQNFAAFVGESDTTLPAAVRTFVFQHINTNDPFFDFSFAGPVAHQGTDGGTAATRERQAEDRRAAIGALLGEAESFLDTQAAYSRELMDYLLEEKRVDEANRVIARLCARTEEAEREFITKYLNVSGHRGDFASHLAPRFSEVFSVLHDQFGDVEKGSDADAVWTAALKAASDDLAYALSDDVSALLAESHPSIRAFTEALSEREARGVVGVVKDAGIRLPDLAVASREGELRPLLIAAMAYDINSANLAVALDPTSFPQKVQEALRDGDDGNEADNEGEGGGEDGDGHDDGDGDGGGGGEADNDREGESEGDDGGGHDDGHGDGGVEADNDRVGESEGDDGVGADLSLDRVLSRAEVWQYCRDNPDDYLAALPDSQFTVQTTDTLVAVINDTREQWDDETAHRILSRSNPNSTLVALDDEQVDHALWARLAAANLFKATIENVVAYIDLRQSDSGTEEQSAIDAPLAHLLQEQGQVLVTEETDEEAVDRLGSLILAESSALGAHEKAALVKSLKRDGHWPITAVPPEAALLHPLLDHDLLPRNQATFKHFLDASGWGGIEEAAIASEGFIGLLDAEFLGSEAIALVTSANTPSDIRHEVLHRFDEFFPTSETDAIRPAAEAVAEHGTHIASASSVRIAQLLGPTQAETVLKVLSAQTAEGLPDTTLREALGHLPEPWPLLQSRVSDTFTAPEGQASEEMLGVLEGRGMAKWDRRRNDREVRLL